MMPPIADMFEWVSTETLDSLLLSFLLKELTQIDPHDPYYTMETLLPVQESDQIIETPEGPLRAPPFVRRLRAYIERYRYALDSSGESLLGALLQAEMKFYLEQNGVDPRQPGFVFRFREGGIIVHWNASMAPQQSYFE